MAGAYLISALIFAALVNAFGAAVHQLVYRWNALARWSSVVLFGISIDLLCYLLLFYKLLPELAKGLAVLRVCGYLLIDLGYLVFIIYFTGHSKWISSVSLALLSLIPILILSLLMAQWALLPNSLDISGEGFSLNPALLKPPFGMLEGLYDGFSNFVAGATLLLLLRQLVTTTHTYRNAVLALLAGTLTITICGLSEISGVNPIAPISILQFAVAVNAIPIFLVVYVWRATGAIPLGQQLFVDTIQDGYLILDPQNKVVDYNPVMKRILADRVNLKIGHGLPRLWPHSDWASDRPADAKQAHQGPFAFEGQGLVYGITVYPIGIDGRETLGKMAVFRNITGREAMEETLRKNNAEMARTNAYLTALSNLTLNLQKIIDPAQLLELLGTELGQLSLTCFVALFPPDSDELVVSYFSGNPEIIGMIEHFLGAKAHGFRLSRKYFAPLYALLETKQIHYQPDEESGLSIFLGGIPGWIKEALLKSASISRGEASLVIPLIANDKVSGLMGVWGKDLLEVDLAPFQVFGSQVAWTIERANLYAADQRQMETLSHSSALVTALSKVSATLETTQDQELILEALGQELHKLGLNCAVVSLDEACEIATIRYVSLRPDLVGLAEKYLGFRVLGYQIRRAHWPGVKAIEEKKPAWYADPTEIFSRIFDRMPDAAGLKLLGPLGFRAVDQLCFLPLVSHEKVIGVMPIWGASLRPSDAPALSVFGNQIAGILSSADSYDQEVRKTHELTRSNNFIVALSNVASRIDSTSDFPALLETLGDELKIAGLSCMVGLFDDSQQNMKIEYLSMEKEVRQRAGRLGPLLPSEIIIPRRLWPTDRAVTDRKPFWDPYPIGNAYRMFPFVPRELFDRLMDLAGFSLNEPVCYLPMVVDNLVIGVLAVWGRELNPVDTPALSAFSNQVALSVKHTKLYNQAQNEIAERVEVEKQIRTMLDEKDILLKEIHHRVKNNLQVISSLLSLQSAQVSEPFTLNLLRESQNRVRSMALIHEKLYQSNDLAHVDFHVYLRSLVNSLVQTYRAQSSRVSVRVQAEEMGLDIDRAIPCGLIVNELVSNSLKYAFPAEKAGTITVVCHRAPDNHYALVVADDGVGLPDGFALDTASSLGLKLVSSLVKQINGRVEVNSARGARFEINF